MNYYNEFDPKAAAWLEELIAQGILPDGEVDQRSITDVSPTDLSGFAQCHFFAGIGGWSLALELAGWDPTRPVWTGSCPCQPFSAAGKQMGRKDPRHLWPAFRRLINRCRPPVIFGEQVASAAGRKWLAGVFANLETMGYAPAGADLCAAGIGAPHIRQRLFWVADSHMSDQHGRQAGGQQPLRECGDGAGTMAHASRERRDRSAATSESDRRAKLEADGPAGGMADAESAGRREERAYRRGCCERDGEEGRTPGSQSSGDPGFWSAFDLIPCRDGKARRVEPGSFPLAHGIPARMGRLRGYGNAIVPQVAAEFIAAYLETL